MTTVDIYVPKVGCEHGIVHGAGIVACERELQDERWPGLPADTLMAYYEGNVYGWSSFKTFADRVFHAADRMLWGERGYPTVARAAIQRDDLLWVGHFEHPNGRLTIEDHERLGGWIGEGYADTELVRSSH